MTKEEDKRPVNTEEDLTLPNLDEGLKIDEIPSIEDLISLDKEEIEKIQETEIAGVFKNNEDTSSVFDDNIDISSGSDTDFAEQDHDFSSSLDTNFDNMNLFDEDTPLTFDEPPAFEHNFDNNLGFDEQPEISEDLNNDNLENNISDLDLSEQPVMDFDAQQDIFADGPEEISETADENNFELQEQQEQTPIYDIDEMNLTPESETIQDEYEAPQEVSEPDFEIQDNIEPSEDIQAPEFDNPIPDISDEEDVLPVETPVEDYEEEITDNTSEDVTDFNDDLQNDVPVQTEESEHKRTTEDVFAKIDSLLNDDSAFETEKTTFPPVEKSSEPVEKTFEPVAEMPKPKYRSSFNPAKYLKKDSTSSISDKEDKLGILYTATRKVIDNIKNFSEELSAGDNPSIAEMLNSETGKKALVTAAVCVIVLGAGIGGVTLLNNKSVEEIETISKNDVSTPLETPAAQPNELPEQPAATTQPAVPIIDEKANVSADAPDLNQIEKPQLEVKQDVIKTEVKKQTKPQTSESYLTVKKIQWQVPDYLSYSPNIKSYLQAAGKSIKLGLSSDLLLATEYAYSNVVTVNLKMSNSGAVQNANVTTSSGSKEIDNIVLQSVKTTLNVVKPPAGEVKTPDFNLIITIYL